MCRDGRHIGCRHVALLDAPHITTETERDCLAAALHGLVWLEQHADTVHADLNGSQPRCVPCGRFFRVILRGQSPQEALPLRCDEAQRRQADVDAGFTLLGLTTGTPKENPR